jgi:predicted PurR-regulated permease PerM
MPVSDFARRTAIIAGIVLVAGFVGVFLWLIGESVLVPFAAALLAVLLDGLACVLMRHTPLGHGVALLAVIAAIVAILAGIIYLGGLRITNQAPVLRQDMHQSIVQIEHQLKDMGINVHALEAQSTQHKAASLSQVANNVPVGGYLSTSLEVIADVVIILVAGIYFAATPRFYVNTVLRLAPPRRRARLREVSSEIGHALRRWLIGRFLSMLAVGIITGVGLALLGVDLAALLAVIAGLLTFIPYLGAIMAVIPALLLGLLVSPMTAIYVAALYLGAHAAEGYVLTPMIQRQTVHVAPAWLILSQLVGGLLAGLFGILLAAPLLVAVTVLVQILYVEDVLHDNVRVLGE